MNIDKKVLIVDDDDNMREAVRETISRMKIEVDTAVNGKDGYEKATKKLYDMIISDMRMPEVDGVAMLEMLKATGIRTPICFITAYGSVTGAVEALKIGAYDYILKPFAPEAIEELVRRTFELASSARPTLDHSDKQVGAIYKSSFMARLFTLAKDIAKSESTILITGESGTGKEVLARYIHDSSNHSAGSFVAVNCAAIPENLLESELFGFEKGAFTDARALKPGKFELAENGTILLDEVSEMPLPLQAKLLRVLQEKEVERLGGSKPIKINCRMLATTNRNLKDMVDEGSFRTDLYYRLNVIQMELPPLRMRIEDIEDLSNFFIAKYSEINSKLPKPLSSEALKVLRSYKFPGNVRELEHTIERAVVLSKTDEITATDLYLHGITFESYSSSTLTSSESENFNETSDNSIDTKGKTIANVEQELILKTLKEYGNNKTKAAEILGITVRTLRNKLNEYKALGIIIDDKDE